MSADASCYLCDLMELFPDMGFEDHCDVVPFDGCSSKMHPFSPLAFYVL